MHFLLMTNKMQGINSSKPGETICTMTTRVPEIDWENGFERHWFDGNAAVTHAFNALSFLFPQGEKYFIDSARDVFAGLDEHARSRVEAEVKGFIAQESTHSHQHSMYNAILQRQGYENVVHDLVDKLLTLSRRWFSALTNLAVVAGYEHYTAILGNYILNNPQIFGMANSDLALLWGWHSAEETEHKSICFDLYKAAGGGWLRRVSTFMVVSLEFGLLFGRVYISMLFRDGCLKPANIFPTMRQFIKFFLGRSGLAWHLLLYGLHYFSPLFHPWNQDNRDKLEFWLKENESRLRIIGNQG